MIYVDSLIAWPQRAKNAQAARHFGEGRESCHMWTDGDISELHAFADRVFAGIPGYSHAWLDAATPTMPHYDLIPRLRAKALRLGAQDVNAAAQLSLF